LAEGPAANFIPAATLDPKTTRRAHANIAWTIVCEAFLEARTPETAH
jgi:hypothetical protein